MSTFAQLAALPGVGVAYLLEVSADGFATVSRRWATQDAVIGGHEYQGRLVSVGRLSRAMASVASISTATVDVVLENLDGGVDWMMSMSDFASQSLYEFRLSVALYDPVNPSDLQSSPLGTFSLFDNPVRDSVSVKLSLADALASRYSEPIETPSYSDFYPSAYQWQMAAGFDMYAPLPLRFGEEAMPLQRFDGGGAVVCVSKGSAGVSVGSIITKDGFLPPTMQDFAMHVSSCTFGGDTWYLHYLTLDFITLRQTDPIILAIYPEVANFKATIESLGLSFKGGQKLSSTAPDADFGTASSSPAAIAYSLIHSYSGAQASGIDKDSFVRAQLARPVHATGSVTGTADATSRGPGELGAALSDLARLGGFDIIAGADGVIRASVMNADFAALSADPVEIHEEAAASVSDRISSQGERWCPRSGVRMRIGNGVPLLATNGLGGALPVQQIPVKWYGPGAGISDPAWSGVELLRLGLLADYETASDRVRSRISLTTGMQAVELEPGGFFSMAWTRGGTGAPYASCLWRVESWSLDATSATIAIEAIWVDDLINPVTLPYLLDNEALAARVQSTDAGMGAATVTDGSLVIEFDLPGGDTLLDYGVAIGDVVVIEDASETLGFTRNRAMRITAVDGFSPECTVAGSSDFGTAGAHAVSAWAIYRGATNQLAVGDDPTNYPLGSAIYGNVASTAGLYSDSSQANLPQD